MKMESVNSLLMLDDKRNPVYKKKRMSVWDILSSVILFCSHAYNYSANAAVMIAME